VKSNKEEKALRVLHVAPTPFFADRGCHMRIRGIVSALNRRGLENIVCTYHHGREVPGIKTIRTPPIPGFSRQEAGPSPFKYLADVLLWRRVCRVIRDWHPDILHGHLHEGALIGWLTRCRSERRKIPLVFDMQGSLVGELSSFGYFRFAPFLRILFHKMETFIVGLPQHIVCSSAESARLLTEKFNLSSDRIDLVGDGVDTPGCGGTVSVPVPPGVPVVIYSGALLAGKGIEILCKVLLESRRRLLPCHFLVVGYPEDELARFVAREGLGPLCTLTGRVPYEELGNYLAMAAVAIDPKLPGTGEASGKLINYMGGKLPVVCFDTENNRKLLGEAGYYAPVGSAGALVDGIAEAIGNPSEAVRRGLQGQRRALRLFSWDAGAEKICTVYRQLLSHD
jgi:glycosyltransferase involved in cell wall biosynthesis